MKYLESHLEVMDQADLLQWLLHSRKTGACSFSQGYKNRRLFVRGGKIIGCNSNEPHLLLGQFLIASGRIDPDLLRNSMLIQERTGISLGKILIEAGAITEDELTRLVVAKAEETVLGLAEWHHGMFRFIPELGPPADAMQVELSIQHVLLEGARRVDEMSRAMQVLGSPRAVLIKTDRPVDEPTVASFMGRRLYDLIDGNRTADELLLQCRASKYAAYTFLSRLVERGVVRVAEIDEGQAGPAQRDRPNLTLSELQQMVSHDHFEAALDLIDEHGIEPSHDDILSMLVAKAEAGYVANVYRTKLPPDSIPGLLDRGANDVVIRGDLSPDDLFLLELVDGSWDVRSLVWISPLRKVDVVRGLARLLDLGYIQLVPQNTELSAFAPRRHTVDEVVDEMFVDPQPA